MRARARALPTYAEHCDEGKVAEEAKSSVMVPKMCPIEGLLIWIVLDGVAQRASMYDLRTPR